MNSFVLISFCVSLVDDIINFEINLEIIKLISYINKKVRTKIWVSWEWEELKIQSILKRLSLKKIKPNLLEGGDTALICSLIFVVMDFIAFSFASNTASVFSRFLFSLTFVFNANVWKKIGFLVPSIFGTVHSHQYTGN